MAGQGAGVQGWLMRLPLLVILLGAVALLCWLPAAHATILRDHHTAQAFFYSGLMLSVLTVMLAIVTLDAPLRDPGRAALLTLAGAYLVLPLAMALPQRLAVADTSFGNAWFEMISSFTTTGATLYTPERLPDSVHLWRGLAGWMGGFLVLLAALAILAPMNLGGVEVIAGRQPGHAVQSAGREFGVTRARIHDHAGRILPIYAALTFVLWLGLLMAGEDGLLALTHAMGTLSTSGISSQSGLRSASSAFAGELMILIFLTFALSRRLMPIPRVGEVPVPLHRDPELRLAAVLIGLVVAVLLLRHLYYEALGAPVAPLTGLIGAFWGAIFTAFSFLTTTGYESQWWTSARNWAGLGAPGLMLLGLAMIGGGIATTAGGVTLMRVYALIIQGHRELERIIHPSAIAGGGAWLRRLSREGAYMAWILFMLFTISVALTMAALTLAGESFQRAMVLGVAALTTTGPLAAIAGDAPIAYATLAPPVKIILGFAMVLGRMETLAVIAMLTPTGWRR